MKRLMDVVPVGRSRRRWLFAMGALLWLAAVGGPILAKESSTTTPPPADKATAAAPADTTEPAAVKLKPEQLESLVAPIALYPDDLLAQTLVASTYPLEIVQLQQWLAKHKELKGEALIDSVGKQPWDPSIQTMAAVPEVVDRLANDIKWTTDLGNAFLAQQADMMDAVQRLRAKAKEKGALESNEQMKVETQVVENKTIIVVESANPEVIYVPSYSPTVVYGAPLYYPYPPIYYPPYTPGAAFIGFGIGMMWGAAWGGSCCGYGWHGGNVNINVNNNFNRNTNINTGNRGQGGGGNWQHNPSHRGGAPYGDKATASKYGNRSGNRGGASASNRAAGGAGAGNRASSPGVSNRAGGGAGSGNRAASPSVSNRAGGSGSGNRAASPSVSNRSGSGGGSRGGDQIGSRNIPSSSKSGSSFNGGSRGYSGSSARSSSSRGSASRGGGGGGGGGSRGGGGGRRG